MVSRTGCRVALRHPEMLPGEVFIGNAFASDFKQVGWATKRLGRVALATDGKKVPALRPIFVAEAELRAAGIDCDAQPPLSHNWKPLKLA